MSSFYTNVIQRNGMLYTRGYDSGKQYFKKIRYRPSLWIEGDGPYSNLEGSRRLIKKDFKSIKESKDYLKLYDDAFEIWGDFPNQYKYISENWEDEISFDSGVIRVLNFDIECMAPPEGGFPHPDKANGPINAITMEYDGTYFTFGTEDYEVKRDDSKYIKCKDEADLLKNFVNLWSFIAPDVITGWNIEFFDVPYVVNRLRKVLGDKWVNKLSPWGIVDRRNSSYGQVGGFRVGHKKIERDSYDIKGITTLDYIALYKKFTFITRESYSLNNIAFEELGEKKLDYSEYENLFNLYEKNYDLFIDYNIKDVELVKRLDDKLKLLDLVYMMTYKAKCSYIDVLGTLKVWDVICYNYLRSNDIIIGANITEETKEFVGGYVKDTLVGRHKWVMSFDLTSLYPHLIMQYNISPETLKRRVPDIHIDDLLHKKIDPSKLLEGQETLTANGTIYDTSVRGFIPELMETYFKERKIAKNAMFSAKTPEERLTYQTKQHAIKILLNSLYGALGNRFFRHFSLDLAESITTSGQLSIRWIEEALNGYMNKLMKTEDYDYIVASDTDSVYVSFESLMEDVPLSERNDKVNFLDKIAKEKIQPFIDSSYEDLAKYLSAYEQKMFMDRENIADNSVFFAKKRYIMNVLDSEGDRYEEPKIKMMGIEAIKSSTPQSCRIALREFIKIMLNGSEEEAKEYYADFEKRFKSCSVVDIAFPRSANNLAKFYDSTSLFKKGTPIHVRGSLIYNYYIESFGLDSKYKYISDGDKIKFIYLKMPNPVKANVISVPEVLPPELGLDSYIDYELQFSKAFLMPVENMLKSINWNPKSDEESVDLWGNTIVAQTKHIKEKPKRVEEKINTLERFFT